MTDPPTLHDLVVEATSIAEHCLETDSADQCDALDLVIHEIDTRARNAIRTRMAKDLMRLVDRLETGARPTEEEERLIEIVVIGIARRHVDTEQRVPQWKADLRRLLSEIAEVAHDDADVDTLLNVRALCRDASDVLPELRHWMVDRERIERYREAAAAADPERSTALARYIRGVLSENNSRATG